MDAASVAGQASEASWPVTIVASDAWTVADVVRATPAISQLLGRRLVGLPPTATASAGDALRPALVPPIQLVTVAEDRFPQASEAARRMVQPAVEFEAALIDARSSGPEEGQPGTEADASARATEPLRRLLLLFVAEAEAQRVVQTVRDAIAASPSDPAVDSIWIRPASAPAEVAGPGRVIVLLQPD